MQSGPSSWESTQLTNLSSLLEDKELGLENHVRALLLPPGLIVTCTLATHRCPTFVFVPHPIHFLLLYAHTQLPPDMLSLLENSNVGCSMHPQTEIRWLLGRTVTAHLNYSATSVSLTFCVL